MDKQQIESVLVKLEQLGAIRLNKPGSDWYQMFCPFHSGGQERKPSFGVSLHDSVSNGVVHEAGQAHCFSCGYSRPFAKFVTDVCHDHGIDPNSYEDLKQAISNSPYNSSKGGLVPDTLIASLINKYAADSLRMRLKAAPNYVPEEELAKYRFTVPYMYQRKLTDPVIEKYDIGFDGNFIPPGRKKPVPCVTFPVHDSVGRTLFVGRRSIEGKYFYLPEGVEKSVFGLYEIPPGTKEIIVCESVFNALTCVVYGHYAVALFGTGTVHEINQLKQSGASSFVLCLDNDEAGHNGTERLKKALSRSAMVWTMHVPEGKDANDLSYEEFIECYNNRD